MQIDAAVIQGLDIGGTKIGCCIGRADGSVLTRTDVATDAQAGPEELLDQVLKLCEELLQHAGTGPPQALGIAAPGPLSVAEGKLLELPNMPAWQNFELVAYLETQVDFPIFLKNDANATALAEWYWGAAKGANTAAFLTMSTGMGAGLIVDGRLFEGPIGLAGEIGRIRLRDEGPVGFGKRGSVEGYCSGPGMLQVAESERLVFLQSGRETELQSLHPLSVHRICELSKAGDPAARNVTDRCARELGRLCAVLVDLLNPDVIVLGTIGSAHPELFLPIARQVIDAEAVPQSAAHVELLPSALRERGHQAALAVAHSALASHKL